MSGPDGVHLVLGELAARVEGTGPPLVLLHGNSEDSSIFDGMAPHLAGFTLVRLDSRGHGSTPCGQRPLTIKQLAIDTARALADYQARFWPGGGAAGGGLAGPGGGAGKPTGRAGPTGLAGPGGGAPGGGSRRPGFGLIGFSDGANIALEVAIHRPQLVAAQVLIGGNATPGSMRLGTRAVIGAAYWALRAAGPFSAAARRRAAVFGLMVGQPQVSHAQLAGLEVPTLVMVAERGVVPRRESQRVARAIPGAEWVELAGLGHMLPRSAPKLAADLAADFLRARLA
jgi:pimeloyl-ACP methyl ester carboxylesterase